MPAPPERVCFYCVEFQSNTRPYGPGGSWVCESCATSSPERTSASVGAFQALVDVALIVAPGHAIAVDHAGPRPARMDDLDNPEARIITLLPRQDGNGTT